MPKRNTEIDVFKHIDMLNGPEYTDPETGEVSRCWLFTGVLNSEGRPWVSVGGKKYLAYRLVWKLIKGEELPSKVMFRHKCDNPICCNPDHGIAGTHGENMDDMKSRERHGMSHHMVRYIRKMINKNYTNAMIAEITGAGETTIQDIRSGLNYAHVKDDE